MADLRRKWSTIPKTALVPTAARLMRWSIFSLKEWNEQEVHSVSQNV